MAWLISMFLRLTLIEEAASCGAERNMTDKGRKEQRSADRSRE
jgi:hypothetical protein